MRLLNVAADLVDKRIRIVGGRSYAISGNEDDLLRRINWRLEFLFRFSGQMEHHMLLAMLILFIAEAGAQGYIERLCYSNGEAVQDARLEAVVGDMFERKNIEVGAEGLEKEDITRLATSIDNERERDLALLITVAMVCDKLLWCSVRQKLRGGNAGAGSVDLDRIAFRRCLRGLRDEE